MVTQKFEEHSTIPNSAEDESEWRNRNRYTSNKSFMMMSVIYNSSSKHKIQNAHGPGSATCIRNPLKQIGPSSKDWKLS